MGAVWSTKYICHKFSKDSRLRFMILFLVKTGNILVLAAKRSQSNLLKQFDLLDLKKSILSENELSPGLYGPNNVLFKWNSSVLTIRKRV